MTDFAEAEKYISGIPRFAPKTGRENLRKLLAVLGNPEQKVPAVHIAGTNGKGSVTTMVSEMLMARGLRTGRFISPHLEKITERISIDGRDIPEQDFAACFDTVLEAAREVEKAGGAHPSFFEFLFLMATVYFAREKAEIAVYETGLGGRLDATNVLHPVMTGITSIGMDHMQYLGNTIREIAGEKAGIIKPGIPVVYHTGNPEADDVIRQKAAEQNSPAFDAGQVRISGTPGAFSLQTETQFYRELFLRTEAAYQMENAATAVLMYEQMYPLDSPEEREKVIRTGLSRFQIPGRFAFPEPGILLDGAHNENAAGKLVASIRAKYPAQQRIRLLFAVSRDKDYNEVVRILMEGLHPEKVYVAPIQSDRRLDPAVLDPVFLQYCSRSAVENFDTTAAAFHRAKQERDGDTLLLITGSLYLAGEIMQTEEKDD